MYVVYVSNETVAQGIKQYRRSRVGVLRWGIEVPMQTPDREVESRMDGVKQKQNYYN